jgi:hypothetical protein
VLTVVALSGIGLAAVGFIFGRYTGRVALLNELEHDPHVRRRMLERLARIEGMRLVGWE